MDQNKSRCSILNVDEKVLEEADSDTRNRIKLGEMAQDFINHPYWPHFSRILDDVIQELTEELMHDPDTQINQKWYGRLLWDAKKHYIFCQIRRKLIKIIAYWKNDPMNLVIEAKNLMDSIKPELRR